MMDRLTGRDLHGRPFIMIRKSDDDFEKLKRDALEKLAHYEDLEEDERLVELPCAVGDTVWEVQEIRKRIQEYIVTYVNYNNNSLYYGWRVKDGKGIYSNLSGFEEHKIGKTIFLTREEAEAALKERETE